MSGFYRDFGAPFASSSGPYGTSAMPASEGHFTANEFAAVPQGQVRLRYDLTPWIRVTVGYDALHVSNVIRPGDQINRDIPRGKTFQQGGTPASSMSPASLFKTRDFYAQGVNAGSPSAFDRLQLRLSASFCCTRGIGGNPFASSILRAFSKYRVAVLGWPSFS